MGSQEGAFENVKMNFSGDQGQTIRQLLSAHMIRRVAMCCLSSLHGKRQHLGKLMFFNYIIFKNLTMLYLRWRNGLLNV